MVPFHLMLFPVRQEGLAKLVEFSAVVSPGKNKTWICLHPHKTDPFATIHTSTCFILHVKRLHRTIYRTTSWKRSRVGEVPSGDQRGTDCNHLITTLGCKALLQYHQKRFRLKIPSFRTFFQARSVIPPDFTGRYLVNHPHPVDSSQQGVLPMSSHFLLKAFLTSLSQDWDMSQ